MSEENVVSNETVVDNDTENVTQESAQNEYIAESKKYRKRAQDAESQLADLKSKLQNQENEKLRGGIPDATAGAKSTAYDIIATRDIAATMMKMMLVLEQIMIFILGVVKWKPVTMVIMKHMTLP